MVVVIDLDYYIIKFKYEQLSHLRRGGSWQRLCCLQGKFISQINYLDIKFQLLLFLLGSQKEDG